MKNKFSKGQKVFFIVHGDPKYTFHFGVVTRKKGLSRSSDGTKFGIYDIMEWKWDGEFKEDKSINISELCMASSIETLVLFMASDMLNCFGDWLGIKKNEPVKIIENEKETDKQKETI